jgi:hypothetical protein
MQKQKTTDGGELIFESTFSNEEVKEIEELYKIANILNSEERVIINFKN